MPAPKRLDRSGAGGRLRHRRRWRRTGSERDLCARPVKSRDDIRCIAEVTLGHYDRNADEFWDATKDHDVSQNTAALLDALEGPGPFAILDLGCGPGRDLATFCALGHEAIGLDGAPRFVAMARA